MFMESNADPERGEPLKLFCFSLRGARELDGTNVTALEVCINADVPPLRKELDVSLSTVEQISANESFWSGIEQST